MRNLLTVCAALVVILGIVSGNLWKELRSARQQIVELQGEQAQAKITVAQTAPVQAGPVQSAPIQAPPPAPPTIQAPPVPAVAVKLSESRPLPGPAAVPAVRTVIVTLPIPERPLGLPTLTAPLVGRNDEERRVEALAQSDRTAAARVASWSTALSLTPEQLQVLNATTSAELRRETEDSLRLASTMAPMDAVGTARLKVDTVNRQYETLTRIADKMEPQFTPEQATKMRTMFAGWLASNMGRARAEEQAALSGR